jgi:septal ring factor EnvC (AmiA/AmiB activator)
MGYDEAAHREHIKWCCQQLSDLRAIDGLSPSALKGLKDSIDHLNQTFSDRSRLEAALSNHLDKTLQAQEALQRALNKLENTEKKLRKTEVEYDETNKRVRKLELNAAYFSAYEMVASAIGDNKWFSRMSLLMNTTKNLYNSGCSVPEEVVLFAVTKLFVRYSSNIEQFERHPKNGMIRKRRNPQPGA